MGLYESPKEILASAHYCGTAIVGSPNRFCAGLGGSAVYLYIVLGGGLKHQRCATH